MNYTKDKKHIHFDESREKLWKGDFYFIQGSDPQLGMIESYIEKKPNPGWHRDMKLANLCVEKINALRPRPKFFVICGDFCDAWPDDPKFSDMRQKQEKDLIEIFRKVDPLIPLVCVCGNHDVGNTPTVTSVERYRSVFGNDFFSFWAGGVLFLVLNSQYYFDGSRIPVLVESQHQWLKNQLEMSSKSKIGAVVFQHIPYFIKNPEETDSGYFALDRSVRKPLLDSLYKAGVRYVFCGHYHRNAGGFYKDMEIIVTSAIGAQLGNDKSGFRVVKVSSEQITHKYYSLEDVPQSVN